MLGLREELPEVQTLGSREGSIYSLLMDAAFKQQCRGRSFKWQRSQRRMCQKHKALTKCVFFFFCYLHGVGGAEEGRRGAGKTKFLSYCCFGGGGTPSSCLFALVLPDPGVGKWESIFSPLHVSQMSFRAKP